MSGSCHVVMYSVRNYYAYLNNIFVLGKGVAYK